MTKNPVRNFTIFISILILMNCTHYCFSATKQVETSKTTELKIVSSPIADDCYSKVEGKREVDTIVVHFVSSIYWFNDTGLQGKLPEWGKEYAKQVGLTKENLAEHKYDWQMAKAIFEAYNVSSHYIIDRDGTIVQLVDDNDRAYHAGRSKMPTDGRTGVNDFAIGIEITSSHPKDDPTVKTKEDAYTKAQYKSLNALIATLCDKYPITAIVGHDEVAPGRKTDPGPLFQWELVRTEDYKPIEQKAAD